MCADHVDQCRQKTFPIPREGLTAQLLDEDLRFRRLREDSDGCPVPWLSLARQSGLGVVFTNHKYVFGLPSSEPQAKVSWLFLCRPLQDSEITCSIPPVFFDFRSLP